MKTFALTIAMICLALFSILVLSEHQPANGGLPVVKSSAAQGDIARANTLLSPCPLSPQNIPRITIEERA